MATKKTSTAAAATTAPPQKPHHRSMTAEMAAELGKKRVTLYLDDWAGDVMDACARKAGDASRNVLVMRLLRIEAALRGVKVPPEEK